MSIEAVLGGLVEYKSLILAGFLGGRRIENWIEQIGDEALRTKIAGVLESFESAFSACLEEIDQAKRLTGMKSVKNQFYLAFVGVPLPETQQRPGLPRADSVAPKPALIGARSSVDACVAHKYFVPRGKDFLAEERGAMRILLREHPALLAFLEKNFSDLKKVGGTYNEKLIAEQEKLRQTLSEARQALQGEEGVAVGTGDTDIFLQSTEEESEAEAEAVVPGRQYKQHALTVYHGPPGLRRKVTSVGPYQKGRDSFFERNAAKSGEGDQGADVPVLQRTRDMRK